MRGLGGGVSLLCSSSFEVFNSFFVIYSSAHISSISALAQRFHSQRLLFSPVAQGLCPAPGWHSFFYLNSEMLTKLNSFFLSPLLLLLPRPASPNSGYGTHWGRVSNWMCMRAQEHPCACLFKTQEMHKKRRIQLEPWLPHFCFFLLLPPSPCCPPPPPKHQLLIFKSTAIAWCGFKSWGAILPDDDSADVNGILIVPSATSETSPLRLLLFAVPGLQ